MTFDDLQSEIDKFVEIDENHKYHFTKAEPSVSEWKHLRDLYLEPVSRNFTLHDEMDLEEPHWFKTLDIVLYLRNAEKVHEEKLEELVSKMKKLVPGFNFDDSHMEILHDNEMCVQGDIFEHKNAKKFDKLPTLELGDDFQEEDNEDFDIHDPDDDEEYYQEDL